MVKGFPSLYNISIQLSVWMWSLMDAPSAGFHTE